MVYLNSFILIHQSQSGFRAGHSTETALSLMPELLLKALQDTRYKNLFRKRPPAHNTYQLRYIQRVTYIVKHSLQNFIHTVMLKIFCI